MTENYSTPLPPGSPQPNPGTAAPPPTHRKTSGLAVGSLICGLGGLVSGLLAGWPAIIMGHSALGKIGRSGGALGGKGLALTGVILGYLSIPLTVVIVILVGMVSGGFNETGREIKTKSKLQVINASLTAYRIRANHFPSELQGLKALVERPTTAPEPRSWEPSFMTLPKDGWDQEFVYRYPGSKDPSQPEVISKGKDGELGTFDDLSSQDGQY